RLASHALDQSLPSAFSEESGEIALSTLAQNLPANDASDISRGQRFGNSSNCAECGRVQGFETIEFTFARYLLLFFIFCTLDTPEDKEAIKGIAKHFENVINEICD